MGKKNSTQAGFGRQAAIDQVRADALKARGLDNIFEVSERSMCIKYDRPVPKRPLTPKKWQEWVENAPENERAAWTKDAMDFAKWLYEAMISEAHSSDDPELQDYTSNHPLAAGQSITHILVALNELTLYIEGKISVDAEGYFLPPESTGDTGPFFVLAMASAKRKPSIAEAIKVSWEAWAVFFEEYRGINPLGASVEAWVTQPLKIESTRERDHKLPVWIARFPRGNFDVDLFSDGDVGELREFANNQVLPKLQMVLPGFERKSVIRDPNKLVLANVDGVAKKTWAGAVSPELRIFVEAIMSMPANERMARVKIKLDELISRLYPDGFHWTNQSPKLLAAIRNIDKLTVPFINSSGNIQHGYAPVKLNTMNFQRRNDDVIFSVTLPDSVSGGPMVEKHFVRLIGLKSDPKWQAYLTLCDLFYRYGIYKKKDGQFNIYDPTKPVERRNADGHLLNAQGEVIRSDSGRPLSNPYSAAALNQLDREPNPKAVERYPIVSFDDMLKACFPGRVYKNTSERGEYLGRAKKHFKVLAGVPDKAFRDEPLNAIRIIEHVDGWQFLPGESHIAAYRGVTGSGE